MARSEQLAHTSFCPMWTCWHLWGSWLRYDTQREKWPAVWTATGAPEEVSVDAAVSSVMSEPDSMFHWKKQERMTRKGFFLNGQDVFTFLLTGSGKSGITKWFDLIGSCCPMMDINSSSNNLTIMTWKCLPFSQTVFKNSFPDGLVQQTMWWVTLEPSIRKV